MALFITKFLSVICFLIWSLSTIVLAVTFVGITVFVIADNPQNGTNGWFDIGKKLIDKIIG